MSFANTALILLASGLSSRFEAGDKLLASFRGKPLIHHAGTLLAGERVAARIAVVGTAQHARHAPLSALGWEMCFNPSPESGLSQSLSLGLAAAAKTEATRALILLADMPCVSRAHLDAMARAMAEGTQAVMSDLDGVLCPPALFARSAFEALTDLTGDQGARGVFATLKTTETVSLSRREGLDVDWLEDLQELEAVHADG
ncbi:MAG: nucleotidyltransferase family protein [Pseudomonadota bacterium]